MNSPLSHLLLVDAHRLAIEVAQALEFEHVSVMGLMVVQLLAQDDGPRSPRDVAAALGCSRPAATQLIQRLVRDGHVRQAVDTEDRRGRVLSLTTTGVTYGKYAAEALEQCTESFTDKFTAEEVETLKALLTKLERGADWHRAMRCWESARASMKRVPALHVR